METLLIILIAVVLVHTCMLIYSNFIDINSRKETAIQLDILKSATDNFMHEKNQFQITLAARDEIITRLQEDYKKLADMHNMTINYLPNVRQKEALRHLANNTQIQDDIDVLAEYYEWIKKIKYTQTTYTNKETKSARKTKNEN